MDGTLSEGINSYFKRNWDPERGKWNIFFKKLKVMDREGERDKELVECEFRIGKELVKEFTALSCEGYIGFWRIKGTGMTISDLCVETIF